MTDKEIQKASEYEIRQIGKKINRIRSKRGCDNALFWARTFDGNPFVVRGNELNQKHDLLACKNRIINLHTGKDHAGRQDDLMTQQLSIDYKSIDEPAPIWEKTLNSIFQNNEELISYVQRLLGYGITGFTTEHVLPILFGRGRNGKSTIVNILLHVLGPYAAVIPSDVFMDEGKFRRKPSSPTPHLMSFLGKRLLFASESDDGGKISSSKVKLFSGGDRMVGRNPHDRYPTEFSPTHTIIFLSNYKPQAPADDYAFWERIHLIPFEVSFVDREPQTEYERRADKDLPQKLRSEASGILSWLVRGCIEWQFRDLDPPPIVREATAAYRRDEDILGDWLGERCIMDRYHKEGSSRLYNDFSAWYVENVGEKVPSHRQFGKWMGRRFEKIKDGTYYYVGLRLV